MEAVKYFADERTCFDFVASLRWLDGHPVCPHCGNNTVYFLSTRKIFKCKAKECRKQFSIKTGTIFEDSAIKLDKWLIAMWKLANAKNGISSYELHRALGITQKSAWFVLHRIRTAMQTGSIEKLSGEVESDETYIGPNAKNMHWDKRKDLQVMSGYPDHKTAVMGMVQRGGKIKATVLKRRNLATMSKILAENIEQGSTVITDEAKQYVHLRENYIHEVINHSREYVKGNIHTNNIENFWSLLKRTIKGTYVSVSPAHLQKYVEEQVFRYNERKGTDQQRFVSMIDLISGKRLTYSQLIGYETSH